MLDAQKAFDVVDHDSLLRRLYLDGITGADNGIKKRFKPLELGLVGVYASFNTGLKTLHIKRQGSIEFM